MLVTSFSHTRPPIFNIGFYRHGKEWINRSKAHRVSRFWLSRLKRADQVHCSVTVSFFFRFKEKKITKLVTLEKISFNVVQVKRAIVWKRKAFVTPQLQMTSNDEGEGISTIDNKKFSKKEKKIKAGRRGGQQTASLLLYFLGGPGAEESSEKNRKRFRAGWQPFA